MSVRYGVHVHYVDSSRAPKEDFSTSNYPELDPSNWVYAWSTLVPFYEFYNEVEYVQVIERLTV